MRRQHETIRSIKLVERSVAKSPRLNVASNKRTWLTNAGESTDGLYFKNTAPEFSLPSTSKDGLDFHSRCQCRVCPDRLFDKFAQSMSKALNDIGRRISKFFH